MYRALYRKWRPQRFEDVVGQRAIVAALKNQIAAGRVGHAYLFTGVRGTGKTTCAKIFAKAVNCLDPQNGDPCGQCPVCRGIDDGSILDVVEMDAASNNGVDDIRDLRDETAYTPSSCTYKVYIIDEVHMLSTAAFNALLKTLEEPPAHVIFILATTEIQKVPATIRSRCQRYDFTRISPEDIAGRVTQVAAAEQLSLTGGAAALIARLADGALRDALSILDTCAGVTADIDEAVVRRMAGVTDRSYLFRMSDAVAARDAAGALADGALRDALSILDTCAGVTADIDEAVVRRMAGVTDRSYLFRMSDAVAARDAAGALAELAALRQQSVDVKRLTEELIAHYRSLMLAALPGGQDLLSGVSPDEEALYLEKGPALGRREAIRAIRALGAALEHMARGSDQRIELELALFSLTEPAQTQQAPAVQTAASTAPAQPAARQTRQENTVRPFAAAPVSPAPAPAAQSAEDRPPWEEPSAPAQTAQPEPASVQAADDLPPWEESAAPAAKAPAAQPAEDLPPWEEEAPPEQPASPAPWPETPSGDTVSQPAPAYAADPQLNKPRQVADRTINPYPQWGEVVEKIHETDPMLYGYLKKSKAYFDGVRVLIDGGKTFRDFIRVNKGSQRLIKKLIAQVSGIAVPIGPYEPEKTAAPAGHSAEESLHKLEALGLDVTIQDSARKRRS